MRILLSITLALTVALVAACAQVPTRDAVTAGPGALEADGPVAVAWADPEQFTEIRASGNRREARRGDWVRELAEHLRDGVQARIGEGERVEILVTDIRRAGDFEPWRGPQMDHVRMMRDIYPPRMTLELSHRDAAGALVSQGEHRLSAPDYLSSIRGRTHSEPLRYEKAMIDRWLQQEFGPPR